MEMIFLFFFFSPQYIECIESRESITEENCSMAVAVI